MSEPSPFISFFNEKAKKYERCTGGCTRAIAKHIISLQPVPSSSSVILDNACGTGVVTEELLKTVTPQAIHAVDASAEMIAVIEEKAAQYQWNCVKADTMSSEKLSFPDETFTHSYTNFGIFFFDDSGSKNIYRTLKTGGTAFVTSWWNFGYVSVIHGVQKILRPDDPLFSLAFGGEWLEEDKIKSVLEKSGFEEIRVESKEVHIKGENLDDLADLLFESFLTAVKNWGKGDEDRWLPTLKQVLQETPTLYWDEEGKPGLPMAAYIAIAKK